MFSVLPAYISTGFQVSFKVWTGLGIFKGLCQVREKYGKMSCTFLGLEKHSPFFSSSERPKEIVTASILVIKSPANIDVGNRDSISIHKHMFSKLQSY